MNDSLQAITKIREGGVSAMDEERLYALIVKSFLNVKTISSD